MFFFFRAEDVIRYGHVTGVQTCALPILRYRGYPIELLDRVAAVAQDPRVAVDVGDRGLGVRGEIGRASCRESLCIFDFGAGVDPNEISLQAADDVLADVS